MVAAVPGQGPLGLPCWLPLALLSFAPRQDTAGVLNCPDLPAVPSPPPPTPFLSPPTPLSSPRCVFTITHHAPTPYHTWPCVASHTCLCASAYARLFTIFEIMCQRASQGHVLGGDAQGLVCSENPFQCHGPAQNILAVQQTDCNCTYLVSGICLNSDEHMHSSMSMDQ